MGEDVVARCVRESVDAAKAIPWRIKSVDHANLGSFAQFTQLTIG